MNGKKNLYILAAMFFVALLTMPAVSADEHAGNEDTVKACLLYTSDAADDP